MHLALFLFPFLLISAISVFREDIPPELLAGFEHINAKTIVEGVVPSVKDASLDVTPAKHFSMCSYFYCHSDVLKWHDQFSNYNDRYMHAMCNMYCYRFVQHADTELVEKQIKNLNSTKPVENIYECTDKCVLNCNMQGDKRLWQECGMACGNLCFFQVRQSNRKEHEQEFLELIMRLKKIGAV